VPDVTLGPDEVKYFRLKLGPEIYSNEDLIIKIIPRDYESDPDVYISKVEPYPNSTINSEW
jgi:hypothetical protein